MERRPVNPWTWQEQRFTHAWRVDGAEGVVYAAGQGPVSDDGSLVGEGDFEAQARKTIENVRTVLEQAGADLSSVVKLTVYLTDIAHLRDYGRIRAELMPGTPPASTAVEVGALAIPGMLIEIDAIAVV